MAPSWWPTSWPWSPAPASANGQQQPAAPPSPTRQQEKERAFWRRQAAKYETATWDSSLAAGSFDADEELRAWAPFLLGAATLLALQQVHTRYFRRYPVALSVDERIFRRRPLLGRVTSVGDGDNFHMFHTPGGRLAGWGWARRVPSDKAKLKGKTVRILVVAKFFFVGEAWLCVRVCE